VHHGVEGTSFIPTLQPTKKNIRERLGIGVDEHVVLNVGAGTFNKGLDLVVKAFAQQLEQPSYGARKTRLVIKGLDAIYGNALSNIAKLTDVQGDLTKLLEQQAVLYIGSDLSESQMDELYRLADTYLTPYRAEGFNIPALEAAARGLRVVATGGGSTDDFLPCFSNAEMIGSDLATLPNRLGYLEPRSSELSAALDRAQQLSILNFPNEINADQKMRFSWAAVTHQLSQRLVGFPYRG